VTDAGLHRLLARQLRRLGLNEQEPPGGAAWPSLLELVGAAYREADTERYTLERSIEISSAEMRGLHEVLSRHAAEDHLTGLPNRRALMDRLKQLTAAHRHGGAPGAVLFIDLDGFKAVNDTLGHEAGDELLVRVAERIRVLVTGKDMVARLGGDEFVIAITCPHGPEQATSLAHRVTNELAPSFRIAGRDARIAGSVGVAMTSSGDTDGPEELLQRADVAMYAAKSGGGSRYAVFDARMQAGIDLRMSIKSSLHAAIRQDQLTLHYQPVVRLGDGAVIGAEALVRWEPPGSPMLAAADFMQVADESRLSGALDTWVIREACLRATGWCAAGGTIAVNMSARTLDSEDVVQSVTEVLHRARILPHQLTLELSEAALLSGSRALLANLGGLRTLGVVIAIDDVGTGNASIARLRALPAQVLKLDPSLVRGIDHQDEAAAIASAMITVGHALGFSVVAEGVERRAQADLLRGFGCDAAQGIHFAPPDLPTAIDAAFAGAAKASMPA
jgi:diguanylate cyclase (GGDEF)-like protein